MNIFLLPQVTGAIVHGRGKGPEDSTRAHNLFRAYLSWEFTGNGNLNVECLRRVLVEVCDGDLSKLPKTLFLQLDNASDNKNNYVLSYLATLVEAGVFSNIYVSFLPVGHTHADIDQYFSVIARSANICAL